MQYWCAPSLPGASVYPSPAASVGPYGVPGGGVIISCQFGDSSGDSLAALVRNGETNSVHVLRSGGWTRVLAMSDLDGPTVDPVSIVNLWCLDGVLVADVAFRKSVGLDSPVSTAYVLNYFLPLNVSGARFCLFSLMYVPGAM